MDFGVFPRFMQPLFRRWGGENWKFPFLTPPYDVYVRMHMFGAASKRHMQTISVELGQSFLRDFRDSELRQLCGVLPSAAARERLGQFQCC